MDKKSLNDADRTFFQNINISLVPKQKVDDALENGFYQLMLKLPSEADMPKLTPREREALKQLMEGKTSKVIAHVLAIDARTVRTLLERVRNKFSCQTNIELALKVKTLGYELFLT
jgi:DNA-binding CsgD family transcriptional regulator